jgi:hypothetical protein
MLIVNQTALQKNYCFYIPNLHIYRLNKKEQYDNASI